MGGICMDKHKNLLTQDNQITTDVKSHSLIRNVLGKMLGKITKSSDMPSVDTTASHVPDNIGKIDKGRYVYILLDVSGSMGDGEDGSLLGFAKMGVYAFARVAILHLKYKVGVVLFSSPYKVLFHPTDDLELILDRLNRTSLKMDPQSVYPLYDTHRSYKNEGYSSIKAAFVYACTALYDICPIGKRIVVAATDWEIGIKEYGYLNKFDVYKVFTEDVAFEDAYSEQSLEGLFNNLAGFLNTTEFISINLPRLHKGIMEAPPLFSKNNIKALTNSEVSQAIASAVKLLP
jgi:hypothetical protein